MGKIGIGDRLNVNSKKNIIFAKDYRKVRLDPRTLIPSEHNKYSQDNIEELADNMLLVGQLQEIIVGRVDGQDSRGGKSVRKKRGNRSFVPLHDRRNHYRRCGCTQINQKA